MDLDSGNRSFLALVLVAAGLLWIGLGLGACVLLSLIAYEVATDGMGQLTDGGAAVLPAVLFLTLVGTGVLVGLWSVRKQVRSSVRLARRVRALTLPLSAEVANAAREAGLDGRVRLVDSEGRFSFAYGALVPRVAVSRGLVDTVGPAELAAVFEHERYHVRNLDPLKVVLARALPAAVFYLPVLRQLESRYIAGRELAADRCALRACGRRPLAGALFKVVRGPGWPELGAAAAIGGPELLDVRVAQLESGSEPAPPRLSRAALAFSFAGVAALGAAFAAPVLSFGGLEAVIETTTPETDFDAADAVLAPLCAVPWILGALVGYAWLARRASRPLDTTQP